MKIEAYINDEALELFLNLINQEYYGEAWEMKMKLMTAVENNLNIIIYESIKLNIKDKEKK
jgi:glycine cleavage system H lipoate-binding protein